MTKRKFCLRRIPHVIERWLREERVHSEEGQIQVSINDPGDRVLG